ncbi:MAG: ABC transporter substrate-binding protein [Pseudomonadota bacterium]
MKLLLTAAAIGLIFFAMSPAWRTLEDMGERRNKILQQPSNEILVGVSWPFSENQDGMADGLRMAQDEINASKLTNGTPIRLLMRNDENNWSKAKDIALEFANMPEMSAVIGYYDDGIAIRASAIYEASQLLHFVAGANSTAMTDHGYNYIIHTILPNDKIARALSVSPPVNREPRKFAVIWEEDEYGEDLAYQYQIAQDALGGEMIYQWSYTRNRADFRVAVNELKALDANSIFFVGQKSDANSFLQRAQEASLKLPILGVYGDTPEMRKKARKILEGTMFLDFYDVNSPTPQNKEFVRKFRARYGKDPDAWAAQGYDALYIFAKGVQSTGSRNPLDLAFAIRFMPAWEGANGQYRFDSRGELNDKGIYIKQFQNGQTVTVEESVPTTDKTAPQ